MPEISGSSVLADVRALRNRGVITEVQLALIEAALTRAVTADHAATAVGAVDWAKLLESITKLIPIIAQVLPIILTIFAPKQPPTPVVNPQPTPDVGVK